ELIAADYVYQIKRLAHPHLYSPIFGPISEYIVGLKDLAKELRAADKALADAGEKDAWLDLSKYPLAGVDVVDRYTYRITLKGRYPQFAYWLAMSFFAPVPIEADRFYALPGMPKKNLPLDWYPVGTGPTCSRRIIPMRAWGWSAIRTTGASPIPPKASRRTGHQGCWWPPHSGFRSSTRRCSV